MAIASLGVRVNFRSILFERTDGALAPHGNDAPSFFHDLNLDQIVSAITAGREEYRLEPFFYCSLREASAIKYRQEIMQDIEGAPLFDYICAFAHKLRLMRQRLAQAKTLYYERQKQRLFLDAVNAYCEAATGLLSDLSKSNLRSRGFLALYRYLDLYVASAQFQAIFERTTTLLSALSAIRYIILISGGRVEAYPYKGELDYGAQVEKSFAKFGDEVAKEYAFAFSNSLEMNDVEARILDLVAQLHPDIFSKLENYRDAIGDYQDAVVVAFDREVQFYIAYLEYIAPLKRAGLPFCYPQLVRSCKDAYSCDSFDLALAAGLNRDGRKVVQNDFHISNNERIIVVSGPNQGGKTTFARTFGQLHYLASLGSPVPGTKAQLIAFDHLFTHFERGESSTNLNGKLQDDLLRIREILAHATGDSIVILNEIFTSTSLQDAISLSRRIAAKILALDLLCIWVTFVEELVSMNEEKIVSMVSTVVPDAPTVRTYKIVRAPADGLAYALSIAEKYNLTYRAIKERISE